MTSHKLIHSRMTSLEENCKIYIPETYYKIYVIRRLEPRSKYTDEYIATKLIDIDDHWFAYIVEDVLYLADRPIQGDDYTTSCSYIASLCGKLFRELVSVDILEVEDDVSVFAYVVWKQYEHFKTLMGNCAYISDDDLHNLTDDELLSIYGTDKWAALKDSEKYGTIMYIQRGELYIHTSKVNPEWFVFL